MGASIFALRERLYRYINTMSLSEADRGSQLHMDYKTGFDSKDSRHPTTDPFLIYLTEEPTQIKDGNNGKVYN